MQILVDTVPPFTGRVTSLISTFLISASVSELTPFFISNFIRSASSIIKVNMDVQGRFPALYGQNLALVTSRDG